MDADFRHSVFGHIFRRYLKKSVEQNEIREIFFWVQFKRIMSRLAFLSEASAEAMQAYIHGTFVVPAFNGADNVYINVSIPLWHISKRLSSQPDLPYIILYFEIPSIKILFDVVKPTGVELHLQFGQKPPKWALKLCKFERVMYIQPAFDFATEAQKNEALDLKKRANFLTEVLYFDNFHRYLKDVDFPHARTVRFHTGKPINVNFLKCWKKSNWNIKVAAFGLLPEDLNAFKELESRRVFSCCLFKSSKQSSIISKTLTDVQIPFDKKEGGTDKKHFEVICKSLEVLKDAFPSLVNITGTIYNLVDYRHLMSFVQTSFFSYVGFFTAAIDDTIRPKWCQRLRLVISVVLPIEKCAEIPYEPFVKELKRQVQRCRKNMLHLNYIYDPVPGIETFDHYPTRCCLAVVQVGTAHADFQFSFKVARGPNS